MLPLKLMMLAGAGVGGMECSGVVKGSRETSLAPSEDSCWWSWTKNVGAAASLPDAVD